MVRNSEKLYLIMKIFRRFETEYDGIAPCNKWIRNKLSEQNYFLDILSLQNQSFKLKVWKRTGFLLQKLWVSVVLGDKHGLN